ncbi:hypothetical protein FGO68_gene6662 [Halteria grandinella]|uniref:Uncharacterized protein n=1 Tax=Halteria grandinella TaxID=5974 RepID=A0A8J8NAX2_HALGN|nr:hypothetical protein FGO68_gene6662 [Halteria grandinella]
MHLMQLMIQSSFILLILANCTCTLSILTMRLSSTIRSLPNPTSQLLLLQIPRQMRCIWSISISRCNHPQQPSQILRLTLSSQEGSSQQDSKIKVPSLLQGMKTL